MRYLRLTILIGLASSVTAAEPQQKVNHLKIRSQALVRGDTVTLADVLVLSGADQQLQTTIGTRPIVSGLNPPVGTTVSHEQIERRLNELGVNLSRVLISGALNCRVTLTPAKTPDEHAQEATDSLLRPLAQPGDRTLAQILREHINAELTKLGGTAEIEFERASTAFLDLTTPPWSFSIQSRGRQKLGLREYRVVIRRDGKTQRTANVSARVRLSKAVLVARKPLNIGTLVQHDAVELETRLFENEREIGFDHAQQVIGQRVNQFVPAGQMVGKNDLKNENLVQRSRPVTVLNRGTNIQVRLTGVALDSGSYGETVRVRLGNSRKDRRVLRGLVTGLGTVQIEEAHR